MAGNAVSVIALNNRGNGSRYHRNPEISPKITKRLQNFEISENQAKHRVHCPHCNVVIPKTHRGKCPMCFQRLEKRTYTRRKPVSEDKRFAENREPRLDGYYNW